MADFKDEPSPRLIGRLAGASASFDRTAFEQNAGTGIGDLELQARIDGIARALAATMPTSPEEAGRVIRGDPRCRGSGRCWTSC
ncbi:hypothetical protein QOM21_37070 [Streptomyces sp. Pv4-95]|uniref:hypothetical protein n=1 Tax=Streptomyces sp. Pv4-95 TaxID=3049543 RepID=UPI003891C19C